MARVKMYSSQEEQRRFEVLLAKAMAERGFGRGLLDLSEKAEIPYSTLRKLIRDYKMFRVGDLERIYEALEVKETERVW